MRRGMAIVHVVMKSSSKAPPAAAHAEYLARENRYAERGGLELVESGNMPEFAREDPRRFWAAADDHERKNGRAYTELQMALPRELSRDERHALARDAARELMGDRFAYTLAVHAPLAKDNLQQPHMHLMFSERAIDERTRLLGEEQFFKRNGAKKDPAWNEREKPYEVREKWVERMNAAMERAGQEQRLDPRSWAEQGREDLAALVEPKLLAGTEAEARERHTHVEGLREQRAELPRLHLDATAAAEKLEQEAERQVAEVEARAAAELSRLDRLIARARELAAEVKERTAAAARNVAERVEHLRGRYEQWRHGGAEEEKLNSQTRSPAQETAQEKQRAGPQSVPEVTPEIRAQIDRGLQAFRESYEAHRRQREQAEVAEAKQEQEQARSLERAQEKARSQEQAKPKHERGQDHGYGHGWGR